MIAHTKPEQMLRSGIFRGLYQWSVISSSSTQEHFTFIILPIEFLIFECGARPYVEYNTFHNITEWKRQPLMLDPQN